MIVLIVDEKEERRRLLARTIREKWRLRVLENNGLCSEIDLVNQLKRDNLFPTKILWWSSRKRPQIFYSKLIEYFGAETALYQIEDEESRNWQEQIFGSFSCSADADENTAINALKPLLGTPPSPPDLSIFPKDDPRVFQLIEGLGKNGRNIIRELIFQLIPNIKNVGLRWVGEGYSDSRLLLLNYKDETGEERLRVLKLTPSLRGEKCVKELANYPIIQDDISGKFIPKIYWNESGAGKKDGQPGVAEYGTWFAVAYDYIGSENDKFCDLALSYIQKNDNRFQDIPKQYDDPAEYILVTFFKVVQTVWYGKGTFKDRILWSNKDINSKGFPPYGLKIKNKREIAKSIDNINKYGNKLLQNWKNDVRLVDQVLWKGLNLSSTIITNGKLPILFSQVHGDLNGNNIRFNLDRVQPFLIDLDSYQDSSHPLQDFARLEVEFKYVFMDCTNNSGSRFLDLSPDLLETWLEIEDILCLDQWEKPLDVESIRISRCAERAVRHINLVRREAFSLHNEVAKNNSNIVSKDQFILAYFSALLYESLQALTYASLPIVKRVLALYGSARIIKLLENYP